MKWQPQGQRFLGRGAEKTSTDVWNKNGIGPILQAGRAINLRTRCDWEADMVSGEARIGDWMMGLKEKRQMSQQLETFCPKQ